GRPVARLAETVPFGPGVVLIRQPVERLLAQRHPLLTLHRLDVVTDSAAGKSRSAGGVSTITSIQVVCERRLRRERCIVKTRGGGCESFVLQAPLGQGPPGGGLRGRLLAVEYRREVGGAGEQRVAEVELPPCLAFRILRGEFEQRRGCRAGLGEAPQ